MTTALASDQRLITESSVLCLQPCELYYNPKPPDQQLFTAAASLFSLTGNAQFRAEADKLWDPKAFLFFNNWNNVWSQGVTILASTDRPDPPGVAIAKQTYQAYLKAGVNLWVDCSLNGKNSNWCKCAFAQCSCCAEHWRPLLVCWHRVCASHQTV